MRSILLSALVTLSFIGCPPVAMAQSQGTGAKPDVEQQELMQLKQEIQTLERRIAAAKEKVIQEHPELQRQRDDLTQLIENKSLAQGYDLAAGTKRLQSLQRRYESDKLSTEDRKQVMTEIANENIAIRKAQRKLQEDEEVQQARVAFAESTTATMAEAAPGTEILVEKLKVLTNEFRQKLKAAMLRRMGDKS